MTEERAQELLVELADHYGQPVRPVGDYCQALRDWVQVCAQHDKEVEEGTRTTPSPLAGVNVFTIELGIEKSNFLARRIYGGEPTRKTKCSVHQGRWSGCVWGDNMCPEGCMSGSNVTGWLPEPHVFVEPPSSDDHNFSRKWCYECGGLPEALVHT